MGKTGGFHLLLSAEVRGKQTFLTCPELLNFHQIPQPPVKAACFQSWFSKEH